MKIEITNARTEIGFEKMQELMRKIQEMTSINIDVEGIKLKGEISRIKFGKKLKDYYKIGNTKIPINFIDFITIETED